MGLPKRKGEQVILLGGRKPVEVKLLNRKKFLDSGGEGYVYKVKVILRRGGRERKTTLAEKEFHTLEETGHPFRNPTKQFEMMQGLLKLNREKKLGLRIIPTIRLLKGKGSLIITKLDVFNPYLLSPEQYSEFSKDVNRQLAILSSNDYYACSAAFHAILDKASGKVVAAITDFGSIKKA